MNAVLRKLSSALVLPLLAGLTIWSFDRCESLPFLPLDPEDSLPATAGLVVSLPRMQPLLGLADGPAAGPWSRAVLALPGMEEELARTNELIDTLFPSRQLIDQARGLLSFDALGEGKLAGTWILDLRSMGRLDPAGWLAQKGLSFRSSSFRGQEVWTITLGNGGEISMGALRNLLIIGRYGYQVEAVLAADGGAAGWVNQLSEAADPPSSAVRILLHTERWEDIFRGLFTEAGAFPLRHWRNWLQAASLEVVPSGGGFSLEGSALTAGKWMDTELPATPLPADFWGMCPGNTAGLKLIRLEDYLAYFRRTDRRDVGRFQRYWLPWIQGPVAELTLRPLDAQVVDRQLYLLGFADRAVVNEALNDWMEEIGVLQSVNYQGFRLIQAYEDQSLFPFGRKATQPPWWTVAGGYVLLANSRAVLENWIDQYAVGDLLPISEVIRQLDGAGPTGQFSFFLDWDQWRTSWNDLVVNEELARILADLGQLSLRVDAGAGQAVVRGAWQPKPSLEKTEDLSWRLRLPREVAAGPWRLQPEDGTDPMLAVQDADHRLYMISNSGAIAWSVALEDRILSPVEVLNLRDRPAITFNTAGAIHLLDLSGQPVDPFPLRLRNNTNTALTVIDFEANRQYRFFVVAEDGCVYGYDLEGGPVTGWSPKCGLGALQGPLLHFQDENKDYLVVQDTSGAIRAFARDGTLRLRGDFPGGDPFGDLQVQLSDGPKQIVSSTGSGLVCTLDLNGNSNQFRLPAGNNRSVRMVYEDLAGDARKDFLMASGEHLALHSYDQGGLRRRFDRTFPRRIDELFTVSLSGRERPGIGWLSRASDQIFLLAADGVPVDGFPLAGSTPFFIADLFGSGEYHLVVGYRDEVLAYRLGRKWE